ncbi:MAG: RNA ligase partner protein [Candidatus Bilamarchaeaceae archaeon]
MPIKKYVLDTSLFVNPNARKKFGKSPDEAVLRFVKLVGKKADTEFYMTPLTFKELQNFIRRNTAEELETVIKKRSSNLYAIYLPAAVLYKFVDNIRNRIDKGLRLAEQFAIDNRPDNEPKLRQLRDKYREALRSGIIDSKEDFEALMLAKELEATIVTADEGAINFANEVGIEWLNAARFYKIVKK